MQVLDIKPRDEYRYGYVLWLDQETAMPLQSQLIDDQGRVVEQILFSEIEIPADVGPDELIPIVRQVDFFDVAVVGGAGGKSQYLTGIGFPVTRSIDPYLP